MRLPDDIIRVDPFGPLLDMFQHGWFNQTTLHPIGLLAVIFLGSAMLLVPRRYALIPMLLMACFVAPAQRIVILMLDFNFLRLMIVAGLVRVLIRNEIFMHRWRGLDTAVVLWSAIGLLFHSLLKADISATITMLGFTFDAMGMYFLFRFLIRDWTDIALITKYFICISVPVALAFAVESLSGRNLFAFFGGVPELTDIRNGRLRVQGAFAHPIIAGIFWATMIPFAVALYRQRMRSRSLAIVAIVTFGIIIWTTASSTPIAASAVCLGLMAVYPLRRYRQIAKWGAIATLLLLELTMNHHVWHLFSRVDFVGGSTGWYRYYLIEVFIQNFSDWWLMGTTNFHEYGTVQIIGGVTNQFVWEGINGGLATLLAFIYNLWCAAKSIGRLIRLTEGDTPRNMIAWAMGAALFGHFLIFFTTNYFGQMTLIWFLLLGMIGSMYSLECQVVAETEPVPKPRRFSLPMPIARPKPALRIAGASE